MVAPTATRCSTHQSLAVAEVRASAEVVELTQFHMKDVELGKLLGSGGFSSVYSFYHKADAASSTSIASRSSNHGMDTASPKKQTDFMASTKRMAKLSATAALSSTTMSSKTNNSSSFLEVNEDTTSTSEDPLDNDASQSDSKDDDSARIELALKTLHCKTLRDKDTMRRAMQDMTYEVSILATLQKAQHPHIIRMHGISSDFWDSPSTAFVVLEKLEEPLDQALVRWKEEGTNYRHSPFWNRWTKPHLSKAAQTVRWQKVAIDLADALAFLHRKNIVFRDLKPANIGFDAHGKLRLFDFACARVLEPGGQFKHRCGTLRYMAPECARKEPYDGSADVYSFGMVLWEVCTLERPYRHADDRPSLTEKVTQAGKHPALHKVHSTFIRFLLARCWRDEPHGRPSFASIHAWMLNEQDRGLCE